MSQFRHELLDDFVMEGEYSDDDDPEADSSDSQNVRQNFRFFELVSPHIELFSLLKILLLTLLNERNLEIGSTDPTETTTAEK